MSAVSSQDWLRYAVYKDQSRVVYLLLQASRNQKIREQVNDILLTLVDQNCPWTILKFVDTLKTTKQLTELARICELGAQILIAYASRTEPQVKNPNLPLCAKKYAAEYREKGWEKRAKFMDCVGALQYTPRPE